MPKALFMVFLLDSKGAKACISCRSRQELSNEIAIQTNICLQNLASIQPRTSLSKFGENEYMYIIESTHQFVSIRVSCAASSAASGSMAGAADGGGFSGAWTMTRSA